jgi:hypothetical protein
MILQRLASSALLLHIKEVSVSLLLSEARHVFGSNSKYYSSQSVSSRGERWTSSPSPSCVYFNSTRSTPHVSSTLSASPYCHSSLFPPYVSIRSTDSDTFFHPCCLNPKMAIKKQVEDLESRLSKKLEEVLEKLATVENLPAQIASLKAMLEASKKANKDLKEELKSKDSEITDLKLHCNSLEQYNHSWSIRINGLAVTSEEETDASSMKKKVYNSLLLPILSGAVASGDLPSIPPVESVLETAHVLPATANQTKPIICRFIFRHKKEFAPRETGESGPHGRSSRYLYSFFEDLTWTTIMKMKALAADERVATCWTSNGNIRYKLVDSQVVKKVHCVLNPVDKFLN